MTASRVQEIINEGFGSATTGNATFTSTPTSGNYIVYFVVADKNAGTFTGPSGFTEDETSSGSGVSFWLGHKISDGTESGAISCTWTTGANWQVTLVEVTGAGTFAVDQTASNITDSAVTTLSSGTTATNSANTGFAVAFFGNDSGGSDVTPSYTSGFTGLIENDNVGATPGVWVATGSVTPSSTAETTISNVNSDQLCGCIITFSDDTGGGGGSSVSPSGIQTVDYQLSAVQAANIKGGLQ